MKNILMVLFFSLIFFVYANKSTAAENSPPAYDAGLTNFSYPFPVHYFELNTQRQKMRMAYMDLSPPKANGQVVVLLHGKNFGGFYWESTMRFLNEHGFRVIVPDQIGFGKSSKPLSYAFSFHGLAENTYLLLDKLKVKHAIIIGHSMGGMLAARFALMYPKFTDKLVLINPLGLEDWRKKISYADVDQLYAQELKSNADSIREYQKKNYYAGKWNPQYEALIQPQIGWTKGPDFHTVAWDAALTSEMVYTQPVLYEFPLLHTPTLLIIGQRDKTAPGKDRVSKEVADTLGNYANLGKITAQAIPNCKLVQIENAGHLPQFENFTAYKTALLDFLLQSQ